MASDESGSGRLPSPGPAVTAPITTSRRPRKAGVLENLDVAALVLLGALAVGTFLPAWALRPSTSALPPVSAPPEINISFSGTGPVSDLYVVLSLEQTKEPRTELIINALGTPRTSQSTLNSVIGVFGFTGQFCTPKQYHNRVISAGRYNYLDFDTMPISHQAAPAGVPGSSDLLLVVHLCWNDHPLLEVNSSSFSVNFPVILFQDQTGVVSSNLDLPNVDLSDYSASGGASPSGAGEHIWTWSSPLSGVSGSRPYADLLVSGSNSSQVQRENDDAFDSGILFGIASGAVLALIPGLPIVADRVKSRRDAGEQANSPGTAEEHSDSQSATEVTS